MGLKRFFKDVFNAITHTKTLFDPVEKLIAELAPDIAADLSDFMNDLTDVFTSLEKAGEKAVELVSDVKNITVSKHQGILLAQAVFLARDPRLQAEAQDVLAAVKSLK